MSFKSFLYTVLKISNDINAVQKGKLNKQIGRRLAGKATGNCLGSYLNRKSPVMGFFYISLFFKNFVVTSINFSLCNIMSETLLIFKVVF